MFSLQSSNKLKNVGIIVVCVIAIVYVTIVTWRHSTAAMVGAASMWSDGSATTLSSLIPLFSASTATKTAEELQEKEQGTTLMTTRYKLKMDKKKHQKKKKKKKTLFSESRNDDKKAIVLDNVEDDMVSKKQNSAGRRGDDDDNSDGHFHFELKYELHSKHWYKIMPFMSSYDDTVMDYIDKLLDSSEYRMIMLGWDAGGGFCGDANVKPWSNWRNLHCWRTSMNLEMKPDANHQDYKELERELKSSFIDLFVEINNENKKDFQADLVRPPHEPLDLVEFQYRLQVNPNMMLMDNINSDGGGGVKQDEWERIDQASDILDFAVLDELLKTPIVNEYDMELEQSGAVCENYKEHEIVTCVDYDALIYTGVDGTGPQAGAIALNTLVETAKKYNWFNVTFPSKF